jgi:valyl-tRNA synthetase
MNAMFSNAVTEAFIQLFQAKLIYRATRMVSWCCHLRTALSDIEVETREITKPEFLRVPG